MDSHLSREWDTVRQVRDGDHLDSMSVGVPAKIGSFRVEKITELPVDDIRDTIERSAQRIKADIRAASVILKEDFGIG
jgi:malate/lactate dehydrogenase